MCLYSPCLGAPSPGPVCFATVVEMVLEAMLLVGGQSSTVTSGLAVVFHAMLLPPPPYNCHHNSSTKRYTWITFGLLTWLDDGKTHTREKSHRASGSILCQTLLPPPYYPITPANNATHVRMQAVQCLSSKYWSTLPRAHFTAMYFLLEVTISLMHQNYKIKLHFCSNQINFPHFACHLAKLWSSKQAIKVWPVLALLGRVMIRIFKILMDVADLPRFCIIHSLVWQKMHFAQNLVGMTKENLYGPNSRNILDI